MGGSIKNIVAFPSPNYDLCEERRLVNSIIIHYTDTKTAQEALDILTDHLKKVSAHYLIDYDGTIFQLVEENNIARHAGISNFKSISSYNNNSIGIEIVNPGYLNGYVDFTKEQYQTLIYLCMSLQERYSIPADLIIGHSDVAAQRKIDPGEKFDWRQLSDNGIDRMPPQDLLIPRPELIVDLANKSIEHIIAAFQDCVSQLGLNISRSSTLDMSAANWQVLANNNIINIPENLKLNQMIQNTYSQAIHSIQEKLNTYGYDIEINGLIDVKTVNVIRAFNQHFYPNNTKIAWDQNSELIIDWLINNDK